MTTIKHITSCGRCLLLFVILVLIFNCQVISFIVPRRSFIGYLEKIANDSSCVDSNGNVRNHLDAWSTNCDYTVCFHGNPITNYKYYVNYRCRPVEDSEYPDTVNCHETENTTLAFPDCCPQLECDERGYTNWTESTEPPCYDRSMPLACSFWVSEGGCVDTNQYYNFTIYFCRQSCGFC